MCFDCVGYRRGRRRRCCRTATCYRDMRRELEAAGVDYQDREVVVDGNLISSRQPADIPAFMQAIFKAIGLA